jgi:hypothetical protein
MHSENMLEFISFIADHGVEFAARRITCTDPTCEHVCEHTFGDEEELCGKTAIWTILLPTEDGVAFVDMCGEHSALLLLAAEEMMEEVENE